MFGDAGVEAVQTELQQLHDRKVLEPKIQKLDSIKLNAEEAAVLFHHNVAKLLFLCKWPWPDIQTAIAFLCTRVKCPDEDDYKKLCSVMKCLRGTINMQLKLETDDVKIEKWWVDASFAVHPEMKSHTGGTMTLGKGIMYGTSTQQKINTKSSTEGELVGVNDVMPQVLWTGWGSLNYNFFFFYPEIQLKSPSNLQTEASNNQPVSSIPPSGLNLSQGISGTLVDQVVQYRNHEYQ